MSEEIEYQLVAFEKGRQLKTLIHQPGWEVVFEMLKEYRDKAADDLLDLDPGDPNVLTAHAAASALRQQFKIFQEDLDNALAVAANPPEELVRYITEYRESADVLKQMESTNTPYPTN